MDDLFFACKFKIPKSTKIFAVNFYFFPIFREASFIRFPGMWWPKLLSVSSRQECVLCNINIDNVIGNDTREII